MDKEFSKAVQTFIKEKEVPIQLIEPGNHRVNAAEMGVKTGKYHLISSLATVAKSIPLQLWCQYIPQIETTLNMLQTCRRDPTISVYEALNGPFDYNKSRVIYHSEGKIVTIWLLFMVILSNKIMQNYRKFTP